MSQKTHSQDSNYDENDDLKLSIDAYRKAAEYDDYLFGDYNYCEEWIGISTSDV